MNITIDIQQISNGFLVSTGRATIEYGRDDSAFYPTIDAMADALPGLARSKIEEQAQHARLMVEQMHTHQPGKPGFIIGSERFEESYAEPHTSGRCKEPGDNPPA